MEQIACFQLLGYELSANQRLQYGDIAAGMYDKSTGKGHGGNDDGAGDAARNIQGGEGGVARKPAAHRCSTPVVQPIVPASPLVTLSWSSHDAIARLSRRGVILCRSCRARPEVRC